jgi:galactokinase/mevalonate kinase-like predicted kinase
MYGGSVLSCSLSERATAVLESADVITLQADGGAVSKVIRTPKDLEPTGDRLDLAKAVLRGMNIAIPTAGHGFTLTTSTDIPMQAGLAGSTALMAAVYGALTAGKSLVKHSIAEAIRNIEYNQLGVICGFQDQYMAVFGGFNYIDFRDKGSHLAADTMPFATIEPLAYLIPGGTNDLPLVLANTGLAHHSGTAHKPVRLRWLDGES